MDAQRSWLEILAGPLTGASIGAMVVIALALAGPGRYYGWRLQKVLDLLGGMNDSAALTAQRRELEAEAVRLSKRVAAIHRVPTEWKMYGVAMCQYALGYAVLWGGLLLIAHVGMPTWLRWVVIVLTGALTGTSFHFTFWTRNAVKATRDERYRFVREGLPADFVRVYSPRPYWLKPKPGPWGDPDSVPRVCHDTHERADLGRHSLDAETP